MSDLAQLRSRISTIIDDVTNIKFENTDIDEGLRLALAHYNKTNSKKAVTTIEISADTYELDISSITGLVGVDECWVPYTSSDPEHPPNRRNFNHWRDLQKLYFPDYELQSGDTIRIFYTALHTIKDLDSGTSTTFPDEDESLMVTGASGYTVLPRGRSITEEVMLDAQVPLSEQVIKWARMQLTLFEAGLTTIAKNRASQLGGLVELPPLDKWDLRLWT